MATIHIPKLLKEDGDYLLLETGDKIILNPLEAEVGIEAYGEALATTTWGYVYRQIIEAGISAVATIQTTSSYLRTITSNIVAQVEVGTIKALNVLIEAYIDALATADPLRIKTITATIEAVSTIGKGVGKIITASIMAKIKLRDYFFMTKYTKNNDTYEKKYEKHNDNYWKKY